MSPTSRWPSFGQLCRYISAFLGSMSFAKTTRQPLRSNASRTRPMPAKNSAHTSGTLSSGRWDRESVSSLREPLQRHEGARLDAMMLKELAHPRSRRTARLARLGIASDVRPDRAVQSVEMYLDRRAAGRSFRPTDAIGREEVVVPVHVQVTHLQEVILPPLTLLPTIAASDLTPAK